MLVEKNKTPTFAKEEIVALKLLSGEEVIARFVEDSATHLTITKPLTLVLAGSHGGQGMVAMAPFMLGVNEDAKLPLSKTAIITVDKARSDAAAQYRQLTSSIQVASTIPPITPGGVGGVTGPGFSR